MKQNIWVLNHYATNTYFEKGGRHYCFAKYLLENNYQPTIFCASTIHNSDEFIDTKGKKYISYITDNIPYVFVKTPVYKGNGIKRILNMISFYRNLFKVAKEHADLYSKPDVILASSVHPLTLVAGIKIAKKLEIPCICEVRDLWPESFVAYGIMSKNNPIIKILYAGEKWIYKKADKLIFTMEGGKDYISGKGWDKVSGGPIDLDKVYHINNGVDLSVFNYNREHYQIEDLDLENKDIFKVIYAGSIRMVNKVGLLLDAAKILKEKGAGDIKFLIWGDGIEKNQLEERVQKEKLTNVCFKGRVDKKYIPYILSKSNLNILNYAYHDIWKYGGSQNKTFEYLASDRPVLSTIAMGYDIIEKYGAGNCLSDQSREHIGDAIFNIFRMDKNDYLAMCQNARAAARDYDFKGLTDKLIAIIEDTKCK